LYTVVSYDCFTGNLPVGHFQYGSLVEHYLNLQKEDERPKEKEKGKPRAIDKFMEELKFEQELRERRNQERDGRHGDTSAVGPSKVDFDSFD
jgi:hypothetical protein